MSPSRLSALRDALRRAGLLRRPTRFVLLGQARSGSNLVMHSLMEHPEITMLAEALSEEPRARIPLPESKVQAQYEVGEDGARFLDRRVFPRVLPAGVHACGMKLFYEHARWDREVATAWDYLLSERSIRIVHLVRRDLLACRVSLEVAFRSRQWILPVDSDEARAEVPSFALGMDDLQGFFDDAVRWQGWVDEAFTRHPVLSIEYERDVCGRFLQTMAAIHGFLDVAPAPVEPRLLRQRTRSPREQLSNFAEAREHFRQTPYARFFEDAEV